MTKLNYEILLTSNSLNNYINYCLTTSSYKIIPLLKLNPTINLIHEIMSLGNISNKVCIRNGPTINLI